MECKENFVAFDVCGIHDEAELVNNLLAASLENMNTIVQKEPNLYKHMSSSDVEWFSFNSMVEVAPSIGFPEKCIDLVSGHVFPDIVLRGKHYGVEIKSTQKDQWTSTGSSIIESTRDANTDRIYMMFGKLGGSPEFKCKPYQMCLSNIAVTHSPRYLIDMNMESDDNIFAKMNVDYEEFRKLEESHKISRVREYYLQKAKRENKQEMPWWMNETTNVNLSFYNDLPADKKRVIQAKACILFQSLYDEDNRNRYRPVSLWLCNNYSLLCPNIRDEFSAGGKCDIINGVKLERPYPHIVRELLLSHEYIKELLQYPDEDIIRGIKDYWDFQYDESNLYESWLSMIEYSFKNNSDLAFINISDLLRNNAKPY